MIRAQEWGGYWYCNYRIYFITNPWLLLESFLLWARGGLLLGVQSKLDGKVAGESQRLAGYANSLVRNNLRGGEGCESWVNVHDWHNMLRGNPNARWSLIKAWSPGDGGRMCREIFSLQLIIIQTIICIPATIYIISSHQSCNLHAWLIKCHSRAWANIDKLKPGRSGVLIHASNFLWVKRTRAMLITKPVCVLTHFKC